jgi:crotonobetainyl-CoA:carnitine CoA-transferase CaiB-like acyl-CoA transferase
MRRGKRSIVLDLKHPSGIQTVLKLVEKSDALIEGMRPGTMERLGLGPEVCLAQNPGLIYGRMTGWGQTGPLAQAAGHDVNFIALSGALWYAGEDNLPPIAPPTLVGDLGGGALYLAVGILSGILNVRQGGKGQIIDAAVVDGSAHLMNLMLDLMGGGAAVERRGASLLDGPHWYASYRCADGRDISIAAVEPKFYQILLERLGLTEDLKLAVHNNPHLWVEQKRHLAELFGSKPSQHWRDLLEGTDACFAPILAPSQAANHPHLIQRGAYSRVQGLLQAAPAPRFSQTPSASCQSIPKMGEHTESILSELRNNA